MKLKMRVLGLSVVATVGVIWVATLVATVAFNWLQSDPSPWVKMFASWGWVGTVIAALPAIRRSRESGER